jgi:hypothetical protein
MRGRGSGPACCRGSLCCARPWRAPLAPAPSPHALRPTPHTAHAPRHKHRPTLGTHPTPLVNPRHPPLPPRPRLGAGAARALAQGGAAWRHRGPRGAGGGQGRQGAGAGADRRALPQPAVQGRRAALKEWRQPRARRLQGAPLASPRGCWLRWVVCLLVLLESAQRTAHSAQPPPPTPHAAAAPLASPQSLPDATSASSSADPDVITRLPSSRGAQQEADEAGGSGAGGSWFAWLVNKGESSGATDRAGASEGGALPPPASRLQVRLPSPCPAADASCRCSSGPGAAHDCHRRRGPGRRRRPLPPPSFSQPGRHRSETEEVQVEVIKQLVTSYFDIVSGVAPCPCRAPVPAATPRPAAGLLAAARPAQPPGCGGGTGAGRPDPACVSGGRRARAPT